MPLNLDLVGAITLMIKIVSSWKLYLLPTENFIHINVLYFSTKPTNRLGFDCKWYGLIVRVSNYCIMGINLSYLIWVRLVQLGY